MHWRWVAAILPAREKDPNYSTSVVACRRNKPQETTRIGCSKQFAANSHFHPLFKVLAPPLFHIGCDFSHVEPPNAEQNQQRERLGSIT